MCREGFRISQIQESANNAYGSSFIFCSLLHCPDFFLNLLHGSARKDEENKKVF